jgi:hypothetical protein
MRVLKVLDRIAIPDLLLSLPESEPAELDFAEQRQTETSSGPEPSNAAEILVFVHGNR